MSNLARGCGGSGSSGGGGMQGEMELGPAQGECLMGAGETEETLTTHPSRKAAIMGQFESKALGLDKAILHSIDCCGTEVGEWCDQNLNCNIELTCFKRKNWSAIHLHFYLFIFQTRRQQMMHLFQ